MRFRPEDLVKSCRKLESGLRLGQEGIHACQLGQLSSPIYWTAEEASRVAITQEMIAEQRRCLFEQLNDDTSDIPCKGCQMVRSKPFQEVHFSRLGHIDLAASTICNLRCSFCGYTRDDSFREAPGDPLAILRQFAPEDVEWDSAVDFNGGEPTLLKDFDDHLEYFSSRRIRVFLYTNAVRFKPSVHDGLVRGAIRWVCTSLDAGTPSTFRRVKGADQFHQVLENLTRYAHAGARGGGMLAVKYVFCDENLGEDDLAGFAYAMLAIRPQSVWLTFDFLPLEHLRADGEDFGGHDFSPHIAAYVKTYRLLEKHGLRPVHFAEKHLALVSRQGQLLLEGVRSKLAESRESDPLDADTLRLGDFRKGPEEDLGAYEMLLVNPLRLARPDAAPALCSIRGKRILLAPACTRAIALLEDPAIREAQVLGFLDRDPVLHGKAIDGFPIRGYESVTECQPDLIVVAAPEQHRNDILRTIRRHAAGARVVVLS